MKTALLVSAFALLFGTAGETPSQHLIGQKDKKFSRSELTVRPGDTVVFKNDDAVTHNVFSSSETYRFNLKSQAPGETTPVTFPKEGTVEVRCAFHPTMKLTVSVKK